MRAAARGGPRRPALLGGKPLFEREIFVTRPILPDPATYADRIESIFTSHWITNDGSLVRMLEQELRARLGVDSCVAFSSGTTALLIALRALDLRGEVITTPFTFPATAHCIEWNGLRPVFCDIDPDTYNLDPEAVAQRVCADTSALLPVHVFGNPCDVAAFDALATSNGLRLIYDAAHCFGVELDGRPIGSFGDLSILSFHATKIFHTGEGGAILARDGARRERIALLRNFGIVNEDEVRGVGLNGKLSELHAAMGLTLVDRIDAEIRRRQRLAERYRESLAGVEGIKLQRFAPGTKRNFFNFTIEIDPDAFGLSRDQLHVGLEAENIITRKYFHPLCSENECYANLPSARPESLPHAHRLSARILSLPLHGGLAESDVEAVADAILGLRAQAPSVRRRLGDEVE